MEIRQPTLFDKDSDYYEQSVKQENEPLAFRVHASLIYKLGESLIGDDITALSELIKNAYDADASFCNVIINSSYQEIIDNKLCIGKIEISDNGCGMDLDAIINGWLTLSNSPKKKMKKEHKTTEKYNRYPLGDKGLGRISVQKLGRYMQMITKTRISSTEYMVTIPWGDFLKNTTIDQIPVQVDKRVVEDEKSYTKIVIKDLFDPQQWKQEEKANTLSNSLSKILSPFRSRDSTFHVVADVNGSSIGVDTSAFEELLKTARAKYTLVYKDGKLDICEEYKSSFFYSRKISDKMVKSKISFSNTVLEDFLKVYSDKLPNLRKCDYDGYIFKEKDFCLFPDIAQYLEDEENQRFNDPGEFDCEIYEFSLDPKSVNLIYQNMDYTSIIEKDEYREFINRFKGIKVVRDGFLVKGFGEGDGGDWLGLSSTSKTSGKYFDLRNSNVIGCVYLTGLHNSVLKETTSREGFVEDSYYKNFKRILEDAIHRLNKNRNKLNSFMEKYIVEISAHSSENIEGEKGFVNSLEDIKEKILKSSAIITISSKQVESLQQELDSGKYLGDNSSSFPVESLKDLNKFNKSLGDIRNEFKSLDAVSKSLSEELDVLNFEFENMNERLRDLFELAGLGLSAEIFAHEFDTSICNIRDKNRKIIANSQMATIDDMIRHLQYVNYALDALRKQMSYFNPGLKFVRAKRQVFSIKSFLDEHREFYEERCQRNNIQFILTIDKDFMIRINKGMLNQVFDNLFNNSEYWLNFSYNYDYIDQKEYHIEIWEKGYILIWDNGIGINRDIENRLFEPFESRKENGRGLGLYIVAKNLQYSSTSIRLLSERNKNGNLYKFEIDLLDIVQ